MQQAFLVRSVPPRKLFRKQCCTCTRTLTQLPAGQGRALSCTQICIMHMMQIQPHYFPSLVNFGIHTYIYTYIYILKEALVAKGRATHYLTWQTLALTLAPRHSKAFIISVLPSRTAHCQGVKPCTLQFMSQLTSKLVAAISCTCDEVKRMHWRHPCTCQQNQQH